MNSLQSFPSGGVAVVQGASRGIGLGLVRALRESGRFDRLVATCRNPDGAEALRALEGDGVDLRAVDVTRPETVAALGAWLDEQALRPRLVVNAAGILHGDGFGPEKRLEDLDLETLRRVFEVNALGPAILLRHLGPRMARSGKAVLAALSARVGSIGDNRLGGWYAYRASKAALNQFLKTAAIELARRRDNVIVAALHPGTTDTGLSKPFQDNVPDEQLFSVERACRQLLDVVDELETDDSGGFFAWDGQAIDW